jgi:hypothetical protein
MSGTVTIRIRSRNNRKDGGCTIFPNFVLFNLYSNSTVNSLRMLAQAIIIIFCISYIN